jgi:SAM-dependent methyltransferase
MTQLDVQDEWYRAAYTPEMVRLPWAQRTDAEVDRLLMMLKPPGGERVLDLGCGTGRHALELKRRGFSVVGVDLVAENVEVARKAAAARSLDVEFIQADLRDLQLDAEFDVVLSLNDGAIGYFTSDAENLRIFEVISRSLSDSGRHLAQIPNILYAERLLPAKSRIEGAEAIELVDHNWNGETRCQEGTITYIGEVFEGWDPIPFRKRLYSIGELADIYASVGMTLTNVFQGSGKAGRPKSKQYEVFVEARKG